MKVCVIGEGPHDIGKENWCVRTEKFVFQEGCVQRFAKKRLGEVSEFEGRLLRSLTLLPKKMNRYRPLPAGIGAKALLAGVILNNQNFDLIILSADVDSNSKKDLDARLEEMTSGYALSASTVPLVCCVPMPSLEAWLLADDQAWITTTGNTPAALPAHPEQIWGERNDSNGDHPKRLFARCCSDVGANDNSETRYALAEATRLERLKTACPESFGRFDDDLREIDVPMPD